jgi:hypothetical protein
MSARRHILTTVTALLLCAHLIAAAETIAVGVSATRARRLASDYMLCYIGGCGGVEEPIAHGDYWEIPIRVGIVGAREGAIHVDRRTGVLSYSWNGKSQPTVSPEQLKKVIKRIFYSHRKA